MRARWVPEWVDDVSTEVLEAVRSEYMPDMPPVHDGAYLLKRFLEVGPTLHTGMGECRLSHTEIRHWQENEGIRLTPWEARTIRRLSNDYMYASSLAEKPDAAAPWSEEFDPSELAIVAKSLKQTIRDLAKL